MLVLTFERRTLRSWIRNKFFYSKMTFLPLLSRSCESFLIANGEGGARLMLQNIFSMLQTKLSQHMDHVDYD